MESGADETDLIGQVVQVLCASPGPAWLQGGTSSIVVGVVEAEDEASLLVRTRDGESLYLPKGQIRRLEIVPRKVTQGWDWLLHASAPPDDSENLLRPAGIGPDGNMDALPRPHEGDVE